MWYACSVREQRCVGTAACSHSNDLHETVFLISLCTCGCMCTHSLGLAIGCTCYVTVHDNAKQPTKFVLNKRVVAYLYRITLRMNECRLIDICMNNGPALDANLPQSPISI